MAWPLRNVPGTNELIEYEARLNLLIKDHSCLLICMYHVNKFSGRAIADILSTHPYAILTGKIQKNPHYIDPIEFLPILLKGRNSHCKQKIKHIILYSNP